MLGIGWNGQGSSSTTTPLAVTNLTSATPVDLFAGPYAVCVRLDDGDTKCWGRSSYGMLGRGAGLSRGTFYDTPESMTTLPYGRSATHVSLGEDHTCVRLDDASIGCFGYADNGMLGNNFGVSAAQRATINFDQQTYTPTQTTSITEGVNVNLTLQMEIYDARNQNLTIAANTPPGMAFNASTLTLSGAPQYTTTSSYQLWINGSGFNITGTYSLTINRDSDGDGLSDLVDDDDDNDGFSDSQDSLRPHSLGTLPSTSWVVLMRTETDTQIREMHFHLMTPSLRTLMVMDLGTIPAAASLTHAPKHTAHQIGTQSLVVPIQMMMAGLTSRMLLLPMVLNGMTAMVMDSEIH